MRQRRALSDLDTESLMNGAAPRSKEESDLIGWEKRRKRAHVHAWATGILLNDVFQIGKNRGIGGRTSFLQPPDFRMNSNSVESKYKRPYFLYMN